ncbi:HSP90 family protein [Actinoplanes regularis]|uniref:Molecular chaperone HtpG n=1 Tax=Actinoplanes regularis TaxID=52697 RepID=A0A239CTT7_9ACTN|nr:HSP90 family protein [Actinoplanes regularis]GIE88575.1 molecular chaperone HtpG [Actinoplanes regularis]SNS23656.1 molecular chaperone HtpG [Actinoplanes regularis]
MSHTFRVDLRGVVDLLSHHLYATPRVYVRELLQNAVDAITARRLSEPRADGGIRFEPAERTGDRTLRIHDTGIGLTENQVHELLATIGRSSKRDDLGFARHEFLGQFGIGLLSCFMVADEIRVVTRCGDHPTVLWTGHSDGRYTVVLPGEQRAEPGTTVTLVPRPGEEHWLTERTVRELAGLYGSMLPFTVRVGDATVTTALPPWEKAPGETSAARWARLSAYAQEAFGFVPFDVIDLAAPEGGVRGVAFVLPAPANPAVRVAHRVYLKQMLLSEGIEGLLPSWAFFVRCVVDTTELRPTASREALYDDSLLEEVRQSLGGNLRGWLARLGAGDPRRLRDFLAIHHLGVKALAVHDDEMLRLVHQWWPYETNVGQLTLAEFADRYGVVRYTASADEFRQMSTVAAAQRIPLINAGYVYDDQLLPRLPDAVDDVAVEVLNPADLTMRLDHLDPAGEAEVRPFRALAQRVLERHGVEVVVRSFDPASLPALYLLDGDTALQGDLRRARDDSDDLWASLYDAFTSGPEQRPQLVFNHRNPLARQAMSTGDEELAALAVEGLFTQALLLARQPLTPAATAAFNQSFLGLLTRAMGQQK